MASKNIDRIAILVIGCGGTGSAFLQNLMPYVTHRETDPQIKLILCDGDTVEEKNLARQVFFDDQVGMNKATALAESIEATFNTTVSVCDHYLECAEAIDALFDDSRWFPVIVSCVDNLKARAVYEEWFLKTDSAVYIDCANEEFHGEVVYATRFEGKTLSPVRSVVFPSFHQLLAEEEKTLKFRSEMDCLQRSISSPQHIFTNKMSGLLAANAVSVMVDQNRPPMGVDYFIMRPSMTVTHQDTRAFLSSKETVEKNSTEKPARKAG